MNIKYSVFDPSGNITVLVESDVPCELYTAVAKELMKLEPMAEQVGFVHDTVLNMAGGEFCGNATLSASARLALRDVSIGSSAQYSMSVSGASDPLAVTVKRLSENKVSASVTMPTAVSVSLIKVNGMPATLVCFNGISHAVIHAQPNVSQAEQLVKSLCRQYRADAFGLMFFDRETKELKPLVYVPASDTLFWESSCASGTAAVGLALASEFGKLDLTEIRQPGGVLGIEVTDLGVPVLHGFAERIKTAMVALALDT